MIPFNVPPCVGEEIEYVKQAIASHKICGDGAFTKQCNAWLEERFHAQKVLLTTSGTTALDMAMLLCDLQPGDEVILPSFTFSSTATSAVLAGARLVFVDIRPDTMNIDETKIEQAITDRTKVIVAMHYAGVACEMDTIMEIAHRHGLKVVEDAAQEKPRQRVDKKDSRPPCGKGAAGGMRFIKTEISLRRTAAHYSGQLLAVDDLIAPIAARQKDLLQRYAVDCQLIHKQKSQCRSGGAQHLRPARYTLTAHKIPELFR